MSPPADPARFLEAVQAWRARVPVTPDEWEELTQEARARAFKVASVANLELLADVWRALEAAVARGETFDDFKAKVGQKLADAWSGEKPWRLETIFRTNVQVAYGAGRHRMLTDPAIKRRRPFWKFSAVLDGRTSPICSPLNGTVLPADDPWWASHQPPLHFGAVTADTRIATARGEVLVTDVHPGDMVLTHRGRWCRVYAVLHKVEAAEVRELQLSSGRVLRVTNEHPVLVNSPSDGLVWREARHLQVGDKLFEHRNEMSGAGDMALSDPHDAPSLPNEPSVPLEVVGLSGSRPVPLPVELQVNPGAKEGHIESVGAYRVLHHRVGEERGGPLLRWSEVLAIPRGDRGGGLVAGARFEHRVVGSHRLDAVGATKTESPVGLTSGPGNEALAVAESNLNRTASNGDAVVLAPAGDDAVAGPEAALNSAEALPLAPMPLGDKALDEGSLGVSHWHEPTLVLAVDSRKEALHLCDLSVEHDETYVANGVLVHNCRSTVVALTQAQAEESGVAAEGPEVEAQEGFGGTPDTEEWSPDLSTYPAPLAEAYRRAQAHR